MRRGTTEANETKRSAAAQQGSSGPAAGRDLKRRTENDVQGGALAAAAHHHLILLYQMVPGRREVVLSVKLSKRALLDPGVVICYRHDGATCLDFCSGNCKDIWRPAGGRMAERVSTGSSEPAPGGKICRRFRCSEGLRLFGTSQGTGARSRRLHGGCSLLLLLGQLFGRCVSARFDEAVFESGPRSRSMTTRARRSGELL